MQLREESERQISEVALPKVKDRRFSLVPSLLGCETDATRLKGWISYLQLIS